MARIRAVAHRANAWFLAVLLVSLIAVTWQSFVTQTHIHPSAPASGSQSATAQFSRPIPKSGLPIDCPICHDSALAGHYLSSGAPVLLAPIPAILWLFVAAPLVSGRRDRSHAWRSRAPPHYRLH